jgi:hypothetical protein
MATIDTLVVNLALNTDGFTKGLEMAKAALKNISGEATLGMKRVDEAGKVGRNYQRDTRNDARETAIELESRGKQAGTFFSSIRNQAVGLFAVLLAGRGLQAFAGQTMAAAAATGYLARGIGVTTAELSAWAGAVKQFGGGTGEEAVGTIERLSMEFERMKMGMQSSITPFFASLNIGLQKSTGGFKTFTEVMIEAATVMQGMSPAQANLRMAELGQLPPGMRNLLLQGPDAVRSALSAQTSRGTVTEDQAKTFQNLNSALIGLQTTAESAAREGLALIAPQVTKMIKELDESMLLLTASKGELTKFLAWLREVVNFSPAQWLRANRDAIKEAITGGAASVGSALGEGLEETRTDPLGKLKRFWGWITGSPAPPRAGAPGGPAGSAMPSGASLPTGPVTDRERTAHDYFRSQGWSEEQTAGILTYLKEESGFRPRTYNPAGGGDGARGMGQWRGPRIRKFVSMYGHKQDDPTIPEDQLFREQLAFMQWELNNTHAGAGQSLRNARTATQAGNVVLDEFGIPGAEDRAKRLNSPASENYLRRFASPRPMPPPIDPALMGSGPLGNVANNNSSQTTNVGSITVNTRASSPIEVAQEVKRTMGGASPQVANNSYGAR